MRKLIRVLVAITLVAVMAVLQPFSVVAAADKETYISEIIIEKGSSAADVKKKITEAGYTVWDKNISNTYNGGDTYGYMYIGYKTTEDPNEAITDIRTMNMGGGYSYAEYEELIKQKAEEVGTRMDKLGTAVKEYIANYAAGKESAKYAYNMMNKFKEDDSGKLLGDYLLETHSRDEYIDLFMQCSTAVYVTVCKALAIACSTTSDKTVFDLADIDNEELEGETQYENTAADVYAALPYIQTSLAPYANSGVTTADGATTEDIDAAYAMLSEEEKAEWNDSFALAYTLESIELSDGSTLYDLFMTDLDELTNEDLYAFASVLSDGQAAVLATAGLDSVITAAVLEDGKWADLGSNLDSITEPVSVYTGVDRSLFEGGVALTSKAMVEAAANADKAWFGSEMDNDTEEVFYNIMKISFFTFAGAVGTFLVSKGLMNWIGSQISHYVLTQEYCNMINFGGKWAAMYIWKKVYMEAAQTLMLYISQAVTYVMWISLGVLLIASAIFLFCDGYAYYHPEYDEIPRILVDKVVDESGESQYINYYSVKNTAGDIIDINQHDATRWLTLYTTKDGKAGKPVLAELAFSDKNLMDGYSGICRFSEVTPTNINFYSYNYRQSINRDKNGDREEIKELYLYMKHSETAVSERGSDNNFNSDNPAQQNNGDTQTTENNNFGSVFSGGSIIMGIVGLVLGGIGGFCFSKCTCKKKKENDE